jgi:hypothetical protein
MVKILLRAQQQIKSWDKLEPYNRKMTKVETEI